MDCCVLKAAFKAERAYHEVAAALIFDLGREHVSSAFLELELANPQHNPKFSEEAEFYQEYLDTQVRYSCPASPTIVSDGLAFVRSTGATAIDALHLAAAAAMKVDELITAELKDRDRPMYKQSIVPVTYLGDAVVLVP